MTGRPAGPLDPIRLEVWWSRLAAIADEAATALLRTAFSTIIRESNDYTVVLMNPAGQTIAECRAGIPAFAVLMGVLTRHLPDIAMVTPIFRRGALAGFAGTAAHVPDIGGTPSMGTTDLMSEGLLIPPLHLYREGMRNEGVVALLRGNVRLAGQVWGDLEAQLAAHDVCRRRAAEFFDDTGADSFAVLSEAVHAVADQAMRRAVAAIPDGVYRSALDADGVDGQPTHIECAVTIHDDRVTIDYAGTSPQVSHPTNCTLNYTTAYSIYPLKILLDPATRSNYGCYRAITVTAPEGSILNPRFPAPVLARHLTGHLLSCAIYQALADVLPDRVIADSGGSPALRVQFAGHTGQGKPGEPFSLILFASAGMGACAHHDGLSTTAFPTNSGSGSIEALEASAPLIFLKKEFRADSGGAGTHRGGLGQDVAVHNAAQAPVRVALLGDRSRHPARGVRGGLPGDTAKAVCDSGASLPLKSVYALQPGDTITISFPGGGGYGPPEHAPLDEEAVRKAVRTLVDEDRIEALAVAFLHSYVNPVHERQARDLVHSLAPGLPVTLSCEVAPELGEYERTSTACVNAHVQPAMRAYLGRLEGELSRIGFAGRLSLMLSSGGLTTVEQAMAFPVRLLESGPAAGAIAAAFLASRAGEPRVIAFDMGGTTAKTCLVEDGRPRLRHEFEAGRTDKFKPGSGLPLKLTVIDLIEIGAGGGSIAAADNLGLLKVGPRSAGSVPGPVAYGRGGSEPTVTDADLLAGYLDAGHFLGGEMPLALADAERVVAELAARLGVGQQAAAAGIHDVVTENMAAAARMHLAEKGRDPRGYTLMAFGGAGPVHAYALARRLKVPRVIVPMGAGVMSAFGFLAAAPRVDEVRGYPTALTTVDWDRVASLYEEMAAQARSVLQHPDVTITRSADMRYLGQGFEITVPLPDGELSAAREAEIRDTFHRTYQAVFGRAIGDGTPELTSWRLSATGPAAEPTLVYHAHGALPHRGRRPVRFPDFGELETEVYDRSALPPGWACHGPALFEERETSCAVGPDCAVAVDGQHNLIIDIDYGAGEEVTG